MIAGKCGKAGLGWGILCHLRHLMVFLNCSIYTAGEFQDQLLVLGQFKARILKLSNQIEVNLNLLLKA